MDKEYVLIERIGTEANVISIFRDIEVAKKHLQDRVERVIERVLERRERDTDEIRIYNSKDKTSCLISCRGCSAEIEIKEVEVV